MSLEQRLVDGCEGLLGILARPDVAGEAEVVGDGLEGVIREGAPPTVGLPGSNTNWKATPESASSSSSVRASPLCASRERRADSA